jgi:adenine phosphoribosyltransferase
MAAGIELLRRAGAVVPGAAALIELGSLGGRQRLDVPFDSLARYEE